MKYHGLSRTIGGLWSTVMLICSARAHSSILAGFTKNVLMVSLDLQTPVGARHKTHQSHDIISLAPTYIRFPWTLPTSRHYTMILRHRQRIANSLIGLIRDMKFPFKAPFYSLIPFTICRLFRIVTIISKECVPILRPCAAISINA